MLAVEAEPVPENLPQNRSTSLDPSQPTTDGNEPSDAGISFNPTEILKFWPQGTRHFSKRVALRDGAKMATEIFLPPGEAPFPVILLRTPYGRGGGATRSKAYADKNIAFVVQDSRGRGDSEGVIVINNENEIADGYDTLEWISKQSWCNGRIGMIGGSGHGKCGRMAYYAKHPNLKVVFTGNTVGNSYLYSFFENGVRRKGYDWALTFRNVKKTPMVPTLASYDHKHWERILADAQDNKTVLFADDGWFNSFNDGGAIDDFIAFSKTGRVYATIGARAHGHLTEGFKFKTKSGAKSTGVKFPSPLDILIKGEEPEVPSQLKYFVMGDIYDPNAPGNVYKMTSVWPPQNTPTRYYLNEDFSLSASEPTSKQGKTSYKYDPRNPAPSCGGGFSGGVSGALDQRKLKDRSDILRFYSAPLETPVEIAGKLKAELYISTDVADSTFIVKLIDVYPDGYEMIVREGAFMARYHEGLEKPSPLEKDKVHKLAFDFSSTAIAFNRGHKIAFFVTSSSTPAYEVHPNTYDPVPDYSQSPVANHFIHCSPQYPSSVILPVTQSP